MRIKFNRSLTNGPNRGNCDGDRACFEDDRRDHETFLDDGVNLMVVKR